MDYRDYPNLIKHYTELGTLSIGPQDTKESLIKKLIDVSYEKKKILVETNAIIREYIARYEKEPELLDEGAAAALEDFLSQLKPTDEELLDPAISLRICRLLLQYYQSLGDPGPIIRILEQCAGYDLILREHRDDYESTPYALMAERYMGDFDRFSDETRRRLIHCLTIGGYNRKDLTFGLDKFRENREAFLYFRRMIGEDDLTIYYYYTLFKINSLAYAVDACLRTEDAKKRGVTLSEPLIDLDLEAPLMEEFQQELERVLASEQVQSLIHDRVSVKINLAQVDYHLGKISLDELLARLEEYSKPQEDYRAYEQSAALLVGCPGYLDYLCRCGSFERQYVQNKSIRIIKHVLANADAAVKELSELSPYSSVSAINRAALQMLSTASGFLDFEFFKRTVLNATVYANKELYVHTMMVKQISLVLLDYILDHNPQYLGGVAGHSWEYCRDHKQEILTLMEDCALLHDIGKYFCLDIVNNSSRALTNDEFDIIKEHPTNFSKIYQGGISPQMQCIRDCAELHHLWYDESGGYPRRSHTANKPFVNILTIADCIDAATDNIGRPYGMGKTLEQVMAEFDADRDTRYCGYVSDILHVEEIHRALSYVINDRRQELYCDIYLHNGRKDGEGHAL